MYKRLISNPYFFFLPFLLWYVYLICINKWPALYGDEIRYADFASNLLHGYYSPPPPHVNLWNGPGYPLLIVPFMALRVHAFYITLMNALYQYLAVVFLYKALKLITNNKTALVFSILLAVYPNLLSILPILYTEAFTCLMVSALVYTITLSYIKKQVQYSVMAGLILGYLVLTKVIFGYVLIICLAACLLLLLLRRYRPNAQLSAKVLLIALAVTIPYLAYTYHLTGKALYWGDSGGMSLYWMSTPYNNEYGDWKLPQLNNNQYPLLFKSPEGAAMLKKNHSREIGFILKHKNEVEQDELFKQTAIKNIENKPVKFISNYLYNLSRMLFNFPYTYSYQDGAIVGNIIRGSSILWASLIGIIVTWVNWRKIIYPLKFILLVTGVYLLLSGALSAYPRQLDVMMPVLLFWFGFLQAKVKKPDLKFTEEESLDNISLTDLEEIGVKGAVR